MVVGKVDATGWLVCRGDRNNWSVLEYVEKVVEKVEKKVKRPPTPPPER